MNVTTVVTICGALIIGMTLGLSANLKRAVASRLDLSRPRLAALLALLNAALFPALILAGLLVDRWSLRGVLILGSVTLAMSLLVLSEQPRFSRAVLALLGSDLGAAGVCAATVVLMPQAFFRPGQGLASLQLGHVFLALGALLTPPLAGVLISVLGLRRAVAVFATLCLAPAFVAAAPTGGELDLARASLPGSLADLLSAPELWLLALFAFFYAPLEASFNVWIARSQFDPESEGDQPQRSERGITGLLVAFWTAFLLARVLTAALVAVGILGPAWDAWALVFFALLILVALGNLASSTYRGSTSLGVVSVGLLLGPIFPALVALVFRRFEDERGTAFALLFAVGSLGSLLWRPFSVRPRTRARAGVPWAALALGLGLLLSALVYLLLV